MLRDGRVLRILAVSAIVQCAGFTVLLYLGPLLAVSTSVTGSRLAAVLIVFGAAGVAGTTAAGRLNDRFGAARVLAGALAWITVSLAAFGLIARGLAGACIAVGVWAVAAWTVSVPQQARLLQVAPRDATVAISLNSSAMYLGSALAGGLGAAILTTWGATALPMAAAALTAPAAAVIAADSRIGRQAADSPPR